MTGTAATTDAVLLAFIAGTLALVVDATFRGLRWWHVTGLALNVGGALLTKGPVGLVPVLSVIVLAFFAQSDSPLNRSACLGIAGALIIGVALFLAWGLPVNKRYTGEFFRRGVGHHVLDRMEQPLEHHGGGFFVTLPFYLPVILLGFLPGRWRCRRPFRHCWVGELAGGVAKFSCWRGSFQSSC